MPDENFEMWGDIAANEQRTRTNQRLANIEAELARQRANVVAKCPACDGDLSKIGVPLCKHCSSKLVWFKHCVALEGEEELAEKRYRDWELQQKSKTEARWHRIQLKEERLQEIKDAQKPLNWLFWGGFALSGLASQTSVAGMGLLLFFIFIGSPILLILMYAAGGWDQRELAEEIKRLKRQ